jgi:PPM family protein phosphatase
MATSVTRWEFSGASDVGQVRPGNEDSIAWDLDLGLALLADGMGGHQGGEVASRLAVNTITDVMRRPLAPHWREEEWAREVSDPVLRLYAAVSQANQSVYETASTRPEYEGMGTTMLAAYFHEDRATLAHIGDSRIFLWRNDALTQLTTDHTLIQEQIDSGEISPEEIPFSAYRGVLTRALGVDPVVEVDMREIATKAGDVFLLCSDGCYDLIPYQDFVAILAGHRDNLEQLARRLVQKANDNGGFDNISVVVARIRVE